MLICFVLPYQNPFCQTVPLLSSVTTTCSEGKVQPLLLCHHHLPLASWANVIKLEVLLPGQPLCDLKDTGINIFSKVSLNGLRLFIYII